MRKTLIDGTLTDTDYNTDGHGLRNETAQSRDN
jgi:hypothetical protein